MSAHGAVEVNVRVVRITDVGLCGKKVWWSKTCINGEQVGPVDFVIDKFVLVGTRGKSGAYSKPLCPAERQYSTQVYSSMHTLSTPHLSS